ncbi:hypothetical protein AMTR_s00022p00195970 [Amborella trichopoda]|uniref:Receptor-like serine/threonine-protein kinase n=2 Tax=Amborella trichopoda TaxID=13333 RepID=W1PWC0_AMBTC|nr:hypothetical protein AMTR_s00022p00195970 [Amborella trichopoda]
MAIVLELTTLATMERLLTLFFYISVFFLPFPDAYAQSNQNMSLGTTLLSSSPNNSYWASPSGHFAFGFYPIGSGQFLVGIWFNKIPEKTLVWSANRDQPVKNGSTILLTIDGWVGFTDSQGQQNWIYNGSDRVNSGSMLDTGNLVLVSSNTSVIWQSFEYPSDTLLPGQNLAQEITLYSNHMDGDYRTGRFTLVLQSDSNLVLYPTNRRFIFPNGAYYWTGTDGTKSPVYLVFNQTGAIYLLSSTNHIISIISSHLVNTTEDYYQRVTLDSDGFFRQYSRQKSPDSSLSWTVVSTTPSNKSACGIPGVCGYNGYCVLDQDQKAKCLCPDKFSYLDPSYPFSGCKKDFITGCEGYTPSNYSMVELQDVDWPNGDYEMLTTDKESCKDACMKDCNCDLAVYRVSFCYKKRLPWLDGRQDRTIGLRALIKVANGNEQLKIAKQQQRSLIMVSEFLIGFSAIIFLLSLVVIACILKKRAGYPRVPSSVEPIEINPISNLIPFKYKHLFDATNGFKDILGRGSFGTVYKGVLDLGHQFEIAVKQLNKVVEKGEKVFRTELSVIGQTHHKNLVQLLGFCDESDHRLLVYEFMHNGTLADFLFSSIRPSWGERVELALGIARGITYLHEECRAPIIHCDIKPQNVLLDKFNIPKIADFGLAKLLQHDQTRTDTDIRGTRGYVAPEWFRNVSITAKVDVYSFGIMLLEIICCRKRMDLGQDDERQVILSDWVYDRFCEGKVHMLIEGEDEALGDLEQVVRMVKVGLWCIQDDPSMRPSMKIVILMLEGIIEVDQPPSSYVSAR